MAKELLDRCVYTIALPQRLLEAARDGTPLHEAKRWVGAKELLLEAGETQRNLAILFADSRDCSRLIAWSVLRSIDVSPNGSQYSIGPLWSISKKRPQDLLLRDSGAKIASGFIRPYALCRTPEFLRQEALAPRPWAERNAVEAEAREGKKRLRAHESRERAPALVRQLKREHMAKNGGALPCQICEFDFLDVYGDVGAGFAEAHHIVPLAEAPTHGRVVTVEDLIVVCANCHRMLHRSPEFPSIDVLKRRVRESRNRRARAQKSTG